MRGSVVLVVGSLVIGVMPPVWAQTGGPSRAASEQMPSRYQVGVMERVLEGAVEHGAAVTRDRLQSVVPATMLLSDNARVRGFRLEGYGVFFDVEVPALQGTLPWSFRTLDQNDLGLETALKELRSHIQAAGDRNLEQALKRVELQVGPVVPTGVSPSASAWPTTAGLAADTPAAADRRASDRAILKNPEEAYRTEVKQALMDAMLDYSGPLAVAAEEYLTIAARRNDDRSSLAPIDSDAQTIVIRARGEDLAAFRAGRLAREEALKRIEVRVF